MNDRRLSLPLPLVRHVGLFVLIILILSLHIVAKSSASADSRAQGPSATNPTPSKVASQASAPNGSQLATLAASMPPGAWAQLATNNFNDGNEMRPRSGGSALEYTDKAGAWDSLGKTIILLGGSHPGANSPCPNWSDIFAKYAESTNTWSNNFDSSLPDPCPTADDAFVTLGGIGHSYQHNTIVPSTGDLYHRQYSSGKVMFWSQKAQTWNQCSVINPGFRSFQVAGALAYFPDRNSLVFVDGDWGVWELSIASGNCNGKWVQRASTYGGGMSPRLNEMNHYNNFAEYSPMCHCLLFGGGNPKFYKMDSRGNVSKMNPAPMAITVPQNGSGAIITVDPRSGLFLVWDGNGHENGKAYEYNPNTDVWRTTGIDSPIFPGPDCNGGGVCETIAIPISDYGVIMFVQAGSAAGGKVYLYKHGTGATPGRAIEKIPSSPASVTNDAPPQAKPAENKATANDTDPAAAVTSQENPKVAGGGDFQSRCSSPGVVRCVGFDSPNEIAGSYGDNSGTFAGAAKPTIDTEEKASGGGSLKFTIPSNSGSDTSGSYFTNFSRDLSVQFGGNSEFYVQWRQRFSPEFLKTHYQDGEGWKQVIIGTGDQHGHLYSSCTTLEIVVQNTYQRGFAQMYHSCTGSSSHGAYDGFQERFGPADFKLQNARSSCLYSHASLGSPSKSNCFGYFPNEWMTFQVHVKIGPRVKDEFANSYVQLWIAREGQPSQLVVNWGPYNLSAGDLNEDQKYGKIWLLPYHTHKNSDQTTPTAYTWYDELIISRQRIPDPK
jgi:hypothetical protein